MQKTDIEITKSYPSIDLGRAYQYLWRLKDKDLTQKFRSDDLMRAIGYTQRGGRVSRVFGTFRQFGFADFDGMFYTLTDLASNLLSTGDKHSTDKTYALQAAKSPRLYGSIYEKTDGNRNIALSDELLRTMEDYGIEQNEVADVLKNYNETLRFIDHGVTFELLRPASRSVVENNSSVLSGDVIRVDYDNNLIAVVPRDLVIEAALHDLAKNRSLSRVRLIPKKEAPHE